MHYNSSALHKKLTDPNYKPAAKKQDEEDGEDVDMDEDGEDEMEEVKNDDADQNPEN